MKASTESIIFGASGDPAVDVTTPAIIATRKALGARFQALPPLTIVHRSSRRMCTHNLLYGSARHYLVVSCVGGNDGNLFNVRQNG